MNCCGNHDHQSHENHNQGTWQAVDNHLTNMSDGLDHPFKEEQINHVFLKFQRRGEK